MAVEGMCDRNLSVRKYGISYAYTGWIHDYLERPMNWVKKFILLKLTASTGIDMPKILLTFMNTHYFVAFFFVTTALFSQLSAQPQSFADSSSAYIELYGVGSSSYRTPFWLHANQFGIVQKTGSSGSIRAGAEKFWPASPSGALRVGGAVEVVGNAGKTSQFLLPQGYGSVRFKNWELFVGRKKQFIGLVDSTLSSGSYAWSGNTMPIPKIQIGTNKFVNVPFTKGWLSFNAFYSDGFFEKDRVYTKDLKLHQKALYLRIGAEKSRLKLYGGFNHQVQWGGKSDSQTINGQMPKGFKNYIHAVTGKAYPVGDDLDPFDYNNRVGNHLGSIDMALEYQGYDYKWFFYRQNIYEDGSLYKLTNIQDGLNGISIKKINSYGANFELNQIVLEFLYTKAQGGDTWVLGQNLGRDNYFNHSQVLDGWSYFDRTIGTPFIPPTSDTNWKYFPYNYTSNNRVMVIHAGLGGTLFRDIAWTTKLSYSNNSGTYDSPFETNPSQFSGLLSFAASPRKIPGLHITGSFAADIGDLYPQSFGGSLGVRKSFSLK